MGRKLKADIDKRTERLMIYLTPDEVAELVAVVNHQGTDKTKFVVSAIRKSIDTLTNPPESLVVSKVDKVMNSKGESVAGYVCEKGHSFWIDDCFPSPPICCPACGSKVIRSTWHGMATRGYR